MATVEVKDIYIYTGEGEYFSLRPLGGGGVAVKQGVKRVWDGGAWLPIYTGMRTMVSDGVDLYFMSDTVREVSGNDFVCQEIMNGIVGTDFACQVGN